MMSFSWRSLSSATIATALAGGCSVMGFFDEPPMQQCEGTEVRTSFRSCGTCEEGTLTEVCRNGAYVFQNCESTIDVDGDGLPNDSCGTTGAPCCMTERDCNDELEALGVAPTGGCSWRPSDDGVAPCTTACGTEGRRTCNPDCTPNACVSLVTDDGCDGEDNDCDGTTDEDAVCIAGEEVDCHTSCDARDDATGRGTCTADCLLPTGTGCVPPDETCDGEDNDCDTAPDNGFACVRGDSVGCTTSCGGEPGTGICSTDCRLPDPLVPGECDPPSERCNGRDDDCDTETDEDFDCTLGTVVDCATTCGTTGTGSCTGTCAVPAPGACSAPTETCNGVDDDCVRGCDDGFACCADAPVTCTTTCGSEGTGTCSPTCGIPAATACTTPAEICNGADDDCDTAADEGFPCTVGSLVACTATCGTTGSGPCTTSCEPPPASDCTPPADLCNGVDDDCDTTTDEGYAPPAAPRPTWPGNGSRTGSHLAADTGRPTFRWLAVPAATCGPITYDLQADASCTTPGFAACAFGSPELNATGLTGTSHRPAAELPVNETTVPYGTRYYWRVRACDAYRCGAWSAVRYVDVGRAPNDFDGDGYSDVLLGAPRHGTNGEGRISLYLGAAAPGAVVVATMDGQTHVAAAGDLLGESVAGAGDVNGDGFADFLAGAKNAPPLTAGDGRAYLFLGGASPDLVADVTYVPMLAAGRLGNAVAGAGDIDADGFADVLIGARNTSSNGGRAYLYRGGSTPDAGADLELAPLGPSEQFGYAVAGAGDVNADGFGDVVVGAATWSGSTGRAYVFFGGAPMDAVHDLLSAGGLAGANHGRSVSSTGDFNDDGIADWVVGVPGGISLSGQAEVFYGGATPNATPDLLLAGVESNFGGSVAGAGDVDGDGIGDLVVGANGAMSLAGALYLYLGASAPSGSWADVSYGPADQDFLGLTVAGPGDVDGDGLADCLAGAPGTGAFPARTGLARLLRAPGTAAWTTPLTYWGTALSSNFGTGAASAPP